ncbi:Luminal-binding protein 5 [Dichanthelium oligosanthes]|uniref:Luminal-binding protein 5 n=1 Tax=Dichanthelium oligosanthes TaxID=888268 RepID=A0A1E5VAS4_9POAL|nr:Luminal-binding protein 5 [Dichanthelium oligosanthes]
MYPLGTVIAIDLGNTNSCVAGYGRGHTVESMFHLCIPSWVAFPDDGGVLVGEDARNYAAVNPEAAFSGFKRLLGKRQFGIEAITATVFAKLKGMAEAHLGHRVQHAVSTLPQQYCSDASRYAVLHPGKDAGLHAMRVLDEPIAAAVAYGLHKKLRDEGMSLSCTLAVALLKRACSFADGVFEFLGGHLDPFFGGDDFDQRVMDHFIQVVRVKHGQHVSNDTAALSKLRMACEDAKKKLSDQDHAHVNIESLVDGEDLSEVLTRAKFEELNHDLFLKVIELVDRVMSQAELEHNKKMIDEVILLVEAP